MGNEKKMINSIVNVGGKKLENNPYIFLFQITRILCFFTPSLMHAFLLLYTTLFSLHIRYMSDIKEDKHKQ